LIGPHSIAHDFGIGSRYEFIEMILRITPAISSGGGGGFHSPDWVNIAAVYAMVDKADQPVDDMHETMTNFLEGSLELLETVYNGIADEMPAFLAELEQEDCIDNQETAA
jgi:hypothetical protein